MIPKAIKQSVSYNDLLIPKEHTNKSREMNMGLWNQIMRINSAFPREEITVEHLLKDMPGGRYSLDMRLGCSNPQVQKLLNEAYSLHIYLPSFKRPDEEEL